MSVLARLLAVIGLAFIAIPGMLADEGHEHGQAMIWTQYRIDPHDRSQTFHVDAESQMAMSLMENDRNDWPDAVVKVPGLGLVGVGGRDHWARRTWIYTEMDEPALLRGDLGARGEGDARVHIRYPVRSAIYYEPLEKVVVLSGSPGTYMVSAFDPWRVYYYDRGRQTHDLRTGHPPSAATAHDDLFPSNLLGKTFGGSGSERPAFLLQFQRSLYIVFADGRVLRFNPDVGENRASWHQLTHPAFTNQFSGWKATQDFEGWWVGGLHSPGAGNLMKIRHGGDPNPSNWWMDDHSEKWSVFFGSLEWGTQFLNGTGVALWGQRGGIHITGGLKTGELLRCTRSQDGSWCSGSFGVTSAILPDHTELLYYAVRYEDTPPGEWVHEVRRIDWVSMEDVEDRLVFDRPVRWIESSLVEGQLRQESTLGRWDPPRYPTGHHRRGTFEHYWFPVHPQKKPKPF